VAAAARPAPTSTVTNTPSRGATAASSTATTGTAASTPPTRANCLKCHAYAGGGDGVKRGDLSWALVENADAHFDVHMNTAGPDLQCQDCHVFQNHKTIGKGSDLRPTDDLSRGAEITCANSTCHVGMDSGSGHASAGRVSEPDRHVARVACQSCHIPTYAKVLDDMVHRPTEVHRDWTHHHDGTDASTCDADDDGTAEDPCPGHPHKDKAANLLPTLKFWNRLSDNYLLFDDASVTYDAAAGTYPTSRPLGDVHAGKLTPFKYKTALQPMVSDNKVLIVLDTLEYLKGSGDLELSIQSGLGNMGYPTTEPYEWVTTDTFQMINHGVNPVGAVADCSHCHQGGTLDVTADSWLDTMGYRLKGEKEQVCNQCHDGSKKLPRTWDKMHNHVDKSARSRAPRERVRAPPAGRTTAARAGRRGPARQADRQATPGHQPLGRRLQRGVYRQGRVRAAHPPLQGTAGRPGIPGRAAAR
jgi:hypothetical protein